VQELTILLIGLVAGALLQALTAWFTDIRSSRREDATWLRDKQWVAYSEYAQAIAHARDAIRDLTVRIRQTEDDGAWSEQEADLHRLAAAVPPALARVEELALSAALPTRPTQLAVLQSLNEDFVEAVWGVHKALTLDLGKARDAEIHAWVQRITFFTHEIRRFAARELGYRADAPSAAPPRPSERMDD